MKKKIFVSFVVFLLLVSAMYSNNILEYYNIIGEGEGYEYSGTLSFLQHGEIYEVNWDIEGAETHYGVGIKIDDYIAVSFSDYEFNGMGIVLYEIHDNYITGFFASPFDDEVITGYEIGFQEEQNIPWYDITSSRIDISGDYILNGKNYNGDKYEGYLSIVKENDYYYIQQNAGVYYYGFAFTDGNNLLIAWVDEDYTTLGVGFMKISSGVIEGKWAFFGDEECGWEKWTKE